MDSLVTEVFERFGCWAAGSPDDLDQASIPRNAKQIQQASKRAMVVEDVRK